MNNLSVKELQFHVKVVGWLHIFNNALLLLIAAFLFFFLPAVGLFSGDPDAFIAVSLVGTFTASIMAVIALPGLVAGIGLLRGKNWARILTLIVSALGLTNFPIGTLIGGYSFYVLLQNSAAAYFGEPEIKLA